MVLWLAIAGFGLLGGMALLTGSLAVAGRSQVPFMVLPALAPAGVLSVLLFVVIAVLLLTLLRAAFPGRRTVLLGHLGDLFRR